MTAKAAAEPVHRFAANLGRAMAEKGLSVEQVADRAEIHTGHLCLILRGKRMVQLDTLVKLAGALDLPPERLLEGVEWVPDGRGGGEFRSRPEGGAG